MRAATAIAVLALFAANTAHADDDENIDCAHAMVQRDMNICADRDYRAADAQLNGAYRAAMARLDVPGRERLKAEERDWIAERDRRCKAEAAEERGGSIFPMVYSGCLTEKTKARTKVLLALPR
jgi:uncharacterized protein YecT (DUF1311 family)